MIKRILRTVTIIFAVCLATKTVDAADEDPALQNSVLAGVMEEISNTHSDVQELKPIETEIILLPIVEIVPLKDYGDIDLLARVTLAEAGNQSEYGQRLVIDTVLNRVDNSKFDNSIEEVVTHPKQYECVRNGSIWKQSPNDYILQLIDEEITNRTNSEVYYFRTKHYHNCGHPLLTEGAHYFSGL